MINLKAYQKLFLLLCFFLSLQYINGASNTMPKSSLSSAFQLWEKGQIAFHKHEYECSLTFFEEALTIFEEQKQWSQYVLVLCKVAENLDKLERLKAMKKSSEKAVEIACKYLKEEEEALGKAYHLLGESYWVEAIFNNLPLEEEQLLLQQAIYYFDIAENIFLRGKHWESLTENHLNMGFIRVHLQDDLEKAEIYLKGAIDLAQTKFSQQDLLKHTTLSQAYGTLMKIHHRFTGDFDKALEYANLSLAHRLQLPNESKKDKLWLAGKYLRIGVNSFPQKGRKEALLYLKKAEELIKNIEPNAIGFEIYHKLGFVYMNNSEYYNHYHSDFDKAIEYHHKGRKIVEANDFTPKNKQDKYKMEAYSWLTMLHLAKENIDSADYWMAKIDEYLEKNPNEKKQNKVLLNTYFRRAKYQKDQNQLDKALITMKPCLEHIETLANFKLNEAASDWNNLIAIIHAKKGHYIKSLTYFQKSLSVLSNKKIEDNDLYFNPPFEEIVLKIGFIQTLHYKAKTLYEYYERKPENQKNLYASFQTYQSAIEGIEKVRQEYKAESRKKTLSENTLQLFEEAISVALQLYALTKDEYYQEQAFSFSERSKANLLIEAINDRQIKTAYLPDSLLQEEKRIKTNLVFYQRLLYEGEKKTMPNILKIKVWKDKIFQLKRQESLIYQTLKKSFPNYFEIQYASETIQVDDIQKTLSENQTFIEFFWGEEKVYAFVISYQQDATSVQTYTLGKVSELNKQILTLIDHHQKPNSSFNDYVTNSYDLYQKLLKPIVSQLKENTTELVMVPDGMLGYVPFEALIMELPKNIKTRNYSIHNLAYFIEDFQVSYTYSASLSLQHKSIFDFSPISFDDEKVMTAYAPSFYGEYDGLLVRSCTDTLSELKCAKKEVQNLKDNWNGKAVIGEKATKQHFLEEAVKSDILHLATHACMDDNNPDFNRIYFADNEYITSLELYALQLKPQLTVLSACNTGSGQLVKGEGIMSLARGFMIAGCPSLITTLWGVNDCTTQSLMASFYKHLYNGEKKTKL